MKIQDVRTIHLIYRYPEGLKWQWSGGYFDSWSSVLIEVIAEDGTTGLGEVYQGSCVSDAIPPFVEFFKQHLRGEDPRDIERLWDKLYNVSAFWNRHGFPIGVLGAIDIALYDLVGKAQQVPVYDLLGGAAHARMRMYYSAGCSESLEQLLAEVEDARDAGFNAYKWRIVRPAETGRFMEKLRAAAGPDFDLMVDAVQGSAPSPWAKSQVFELAKAIAPHRPAWLEEPFRIEHPELYAELRRTVPYPISGAESATSVPEFERFLDAEAVDIVQPDLTMAGGFTLAKRVGALAESRKVRLAVHCWGGAVSLMANLHFGFSQPSCLWAEYPRYPNPLREEFLVEPLLVKGGCVEPPRQPGLGVELREDLVRKYRASGSAAAGLVFEVKSSR
jgi:L-alanine-DL-glutamate epimerase-like enolase superfamily enzyme